MEPPRLELLCDKETAGEHYGDCIWCVATNPSAFGDMSANRSRVLSHYTDGEKNPMYPAALLYQNGKRRVLIYAFDLSFQAGGKHHQLLLDYGKQAQLHSVLRSFGDGPLPVSVCGEPNIHVVLRRSPDGEVYSAAIQNLNTERVEQLTLTLAPYLDPESAELLPHRAERPVRPEFSVEGCGPVNIMHINCPLPGMGMVCVKFKKR